MFWVKHGTCFREFSGSGVWGYRVLGFRVQGKTRVIYKVQGKGVVKV